jgi:hypothetical protein
MTMEPSTPALAVSCRSGAAPGAADDVDADLGVAGGLHVLEGGLGADEGDATAFVAPGFGTIW